MANINLPNDYVKIDTLPEDPKDSETYAVQTNSFSAYIMTFPISNERAMPFDNTEAIIQGIHKALGDEQGLIEVKNGVTHKSSPYVYSIVKSHKQPSGMQYILALDIKEENRVTHIQGYFDEMGVTGQRDALVLNLLVNEGKLDFPPTSGWMEDPYDKTYDKGIPMNMSEKEEYDKMFPDHPLSQLRAVVRYIEENN